MIQEFKVGDLVEINCGTMAVNMSGTAVIRKRVGIDSYNVVWLKIKSNHKCDRKDFPVHRMKKIA